MEIIGEQKYVTSCKSCDSIIVYKASDTKYEFIPGTYGRIKIPSVSYYYITCPKCKNKVTVKFNPYED